ncbi:MAG: magnesium transporter [Thermoleophilia bacterium]
MERAGDLLDAMNPDDAADLLGEVPALERASLLAAMEPDEAAPVRRLLAYRPDTAGGLMNPEPVILQANATVAEALARMRRPELPPALAAQAYVVRPPTDTPTGPLLGTVHIQRLLRAPPSELAATCIDRRDPDPLPADAPVRTVAEHLAAENLLAAPVCDQAGRLLGAVSVDDVLDSMLGDLWRDRDPGEAA